MLEERTIRHSGLTVSRVCLGTMTFGAQCDEAVAAAMLDCYLDHGLNFVDTANVYNRGRSEEILGRILKRHRDRVVLASKVGIKAGDAPDQQGLSPRAIRRAIDESLQRLQSDQLDVYYLHQPDYSTPPEESLATIHELVGEGKLRVLGASNYASWQVCRLLWLAERNGWPAVEIVQPMYNLLSRGIEQELLPMCREFGLTTAAYNPLAGGLLTGKHRLEATVAGSRFDGNQVYRDRYWHEANFESVRRLTETARETGSSLVSLALRWILHHTPIDCIVLGASRLEQLQENLAAVEQGPLPPEAVEACQQVWKSLRGVSPAYNR